MKRLMAFIVLLAISIFIVSGCSNTASNENVYSGTIESTTVNVQSEISGRVETVKVQEGDAVKKGQILAYIDIKELQDKEKQAEAAVEAAQAQYSNAKDTYLLQEKVNEADIQAAQASLNQATAQYIKVKNGARAQEIEQAKAKLDEAKVALDVAEKSYQRTSQLLESGAVSQQTLDEVKAKYQAAIDDVHYAEEALSLIQEGAQPEDIQSAAAAVEQAKAAIMKAEAGKLQTATAGETVKVAEANLNAAKAALDEVKTNIENATIKAPCDGIITTKYVEEGEIITSGGSIAEISDLSNLWIKIYVPEKYLYKVSLNKDVAISVNSINKKISGKVVYISPNGEFTPKNATTESSKEDIVYEVKIQIKDNVKELKPGMLADVTI